MPDTPTTRQTAASGRQMRPLTARERDLQGRRLKHHLRELGLNHYDFALPETHALPYVVHPDEEIEGIVFGRYRLEIPHLTGRGALVATANRVVLVDKKPMYIKSDELVYGAINGTSYSRVGLAGTVVLHTKIGDIKLRSMNRKCSQYFVEAIEKNLARYRGNLPLDESYTETI